jgi:hypothetical protein
MIGQFCFYPYSNLCGANGRGVKLITETAPKSEVLHDKKVMVIIVTIITMAATVTAVLIT